MRWIGPFVLSFLLVALPPITHSDDTAAPRTSLQEITRDAEERLRQWDAEDLEEERYAGRNWFLQIIDLAFSLALIRGAHFSSVRFSGGNLTLQNGANPAGASSTAPSK
jgi:hypothetical protein